MFVLEPVGDPLAGLDPNGQLIPGDYESQHDLEDDHEADRDDAGEGDDYEEHQLLTTPDPVDYPLPHPDLLSLHAALMRVARAAGATAIEEDEFIWSDEEELEQKRDGRSTDEHLSYTLRRFLEGTV
ncbi:hypothetical protein L211DRAFT_846109 [Terfezia boudieri ATCC MYA-4762]|uniref:Uncharacterized protein n=1 Tax=Terfezia boudieri ATCC MYA-4762 TaxID=1051890 RepID=A0A3N4M1L1_9PEZI|nr:hypothetical protein L211DRAFT_846109 [Terfezia boudieri ATCC MYA-4762]